MGVGHVPPGPLREAGQGDDVSRREHRGAGAFVVDLRDRRTLARLGEDVAAAFLAGRGAMVLERNVRAGGGELDLVVAHDGDVVAVEVKTIGPEAVADPVDRIDATKLAQVRRVAAQSRYRVNRVDFVGVRVMKRGVLVNWRSNAG